MFTIWWYLALCFCYCCKSTLEVITSSFSKKESEGGLIAKAWFLGWTSSCSTVTMVIDISSKSHRLWSFWLSSKAPTFAQSLHQIVCLISQKFINVRMIPLKFSLILIFDKGILHTEFWGKKDLTKNLHQKNSCPSSEFCTQLRTRTHRAPSRHGRRQRRLRDSRDRPEQGLWPCLAEWYDSVKMLKSTLIRWHENWSHLNRS